MISEKPVRIDKFLWCVRLYKTRSMATDACKSGKVSIKGVQVKPSHEVRQGEIYSIRLNYLIRVIKVKEILYNRVAARFVPDYIEDLTPAEEYEKFQQIRMMRQGIRPAGYGRPTKRERRKLDDFMDF